MSLAARLLATLVMSTIIASPLGLCTGWQATPQARMACCVEGAECPMRSHERDGSNVAQSVQQAEADSCCAASESRGSTRAVATAAIALAMPARVAVLLDPPAVTPLPDRRSSADTGPPRHVPRHVFHSVFVI